MSRENAAARLSTLLAAFFALFVLFLYGPLSAIVILSFQGPDGRPDLPDATACRCTGSPTCSRSRRSAISAAASSAR